MQCCVTVNDQFSGNDRFSGTKNPDDAILFTVSGITVLVELFWKILTLIVNFLTFFMQKVMIYEKNMTKSVKTQEKVKLKVKSLE